MKRKNNRPPAFDFRAIAPLLMVFPATGILVVVIGIGMLWELALHSENGTIQPTESYVEETVKVPLNSKEPVYTENKYSDRVAISISGSVERNGEFFFDALHLYDDLEQGSLDGFPAFLIDGNFVVFLLMPTPKYRNDHVYRFPYSVFRNMRDTNLHRPRTIGFQMIYEAAIGMDAEFIVEVSSDPFKYWPRSRGT